MLERKRGKLNIKKLGEIIKIARNKLPNIKFNENQEKVLPRNENEQTILNAFKKILKIEDVYMTSDFFEVGGDSLMASKLVVELQNNNILLQNEINLAKRLQYAMILMRVKEDFQWLIQKII